MRFMCVGVLAGVRRGRWLVRISIPYSMDFEGSGPEVKHLRCAQGADALRDGGRAKN